MLIFSSFVLALPAQKLPQCQLLTTADGLSQGMIFDVLQSRDGFIWLATNDGLNCYDGSRFEVFTPDPFNPFSISNSEINRLFEDHNGLIWASTATQLEVFDPKNKRFYHVFHNGQPVFSSNHNSFEQTPDGTIWLTDDYYLWKINLSPGDLEKAAATGSANVAPVCEHVLLQDAAGPANGQEPLRCAKVLFSRQQKLLLGTNHGLYRLDRETGKLAPEYLIPAIELRGLAENKAGQIVLMGRLPSKCRLWVCISATGVQQVEDCPLINYPRNVFSFDEADYLWTYRGGMIQKWRVSAFFNREKPELEISGEVALLKDEQGGYCTRFLFDKSGVGWIGTNGFGVIKMNKNTSKFKTALPNITQRLILEAPDGGFYSLESPQVKYRSIAFDQPGPNTDFFGRFHPTDYSSVGRLAACFDRAGNGWSLSRSDSFLYRMDAVTKVQTAFPWRGFGLLCTRYGQLLSLETTGLRQFDPQSQTTAVFAFDQPQKRLLENSHFLYEDAAGVIWIMGMQGLIRATPDQGRYRFTFFRNEPSDRFSLSSNIVQSVADDPLDPHLYLWVGTKGGGLNRLDKKTGQFRQYKTEQGLPDNVVYGVLAPNRPLGSTAPGYIWLSTNKGLCRFDVRAETTKNFTVADGLQENEFNNASYLKTRNGTLIFGGVKGLTVFHPDSLRFNKVLPQTRIVGLQVNNKKYDIAGRSSVVLAHYQNLLTFDFAALEFTNPAQNQYRYQLVGVDKNWVDLGNKNSIQFANLAPGTYIFMVLGSNNDGLWSEQPAQLQFTIRPPWWASWWAYLVYLALVATAIWAYYQYLLRQRISEQEKLRLRELADFKSRFFTNITHEFRTPLTVMLGVGAQLAQAETDEPKLNKLDLIKRSGENLLRLVNQILDLAKLESDALNMHYVQGDILTFIKYIAESLHSLANAQNLLLRVESTESTLVMDYDPERFLQIIHNLLSNAIKFTPSGGKVLVQVAAKDAWLHVAVKDSGAGIPPEELPHLFDRFFQARNQAYANAGGTGIGLSLTRELVKAMGGEISVESTVGAGTTFLVKLPITNRADLEEKVSLERIPMGRERWSAAGTVVPAGTEPDGYSILIIEDNPDVVEYLESCWGDPRGRPIVPDPGSKGDRRGDPRGRPIVPDPGSMDRPNSPISDNSQGDGMVDYPKLGDHKGRPNGRPDGRPNIYFAYNGQAGIEKALETIPDLIISDVMMPIKDGFEVVETLKNDERTSHIPIILLTAKADVQSRLAGLRRGADAYLSKPFHQEELLVTVDNLLETRKKLQLKYQQTIFTTEAPVTPERPLAKENTDVEDVFLQNIRLLIEENYTQEDFGLPQLCLKAGMSRSQLFRKMKALTDIAPSDLIRSHRLNRAKALLESGTVNVAEAAWRVGFKDPSYFSKLYQEEFGVAPSAVKR